MYRGGVEYYLHYFYLTLYFLYIYNYIVIVK